jgi:hypothetical protein
MNNISLKQPQFFKTMSTDMDVFNVSMVGLEQDAEEELWRNREKEELDTENMSNIVDKASTTLAIQLLSTKYGFDAREACMYIVSCNVKKVIKKRVMKKKVIDVPVVETPVVETPVVDVPVVDAPVVVSDKKEKVVKEKKEKVEKVPKEKKEKVVKEKVVKEKVVKEKVVKEKVVKEKVVKEKVVKPPKEKKEKPVKEKKEKVVPIIEPSVANVVEVVSDEEGQMYMAFIEKQKYWTPDEYFQNGPIHKSIINDEGDSAPGELLGQFVNGQAIFNESK